MVDNIRSLPESIFYSGVYFLFPDASSCRPAVQDISVGIFEFSLVRVQQLAVAVSPTYRQVE
jgi:hypothetical protein